MQAKVELVAITPNCKEVIERAARLCYSSFSKAGPGSAEPLIRRAIECGHHSILEHAYVSFLIIGLSRACTHQLVRHRLCAFSQRSQRFVGEENFYYILPPSIPPELTKEFDDDMKVIRSMYRKWRQKLPREDARFVLPNACASQIVVSANFREWRHILCLRCQKSAQWEIRSICLQILLILNKESPSVFQDFVIDEETATAYTPFPS